MADVSARLRPDLAPRWHTLALVALIVAVAITGTLVARSSAAPPRDVGVDDALLGYAQIVAVQALLLAYAARIARGRWRLRELVGRTWTGRRAVTDLAIAVALVVAIIGLETIWSTLMPARPDAAPPTFLPRTILQLATWLVVAVVVGTCEELVHRGYLQPHLGALVRSEPLGCVLSAALFGLAHLEQGLSAAVRIGVYGALLGAVTLHRKSVIPGVIAHVAIDVAAGVAALR